jgi:hypothetical protein
VRCLQTDAVSNKKFLHLRSKLTHHRLFQEKATRLILPQWILQCLFDLQPYMISLLIHYQKFGRQFNMKPSRIWGCLLPSHTSPPPQLRQPHPCRPLFGSLLALGCYSFPYLHAVLISATSVALVFFATATTRHNLVWRMLAGMEYCLTLLWTTVMYGYREIVSWVCPLQLFPSPLIIWEILLQDS